LILNDRELETTVEVLKTVCTLVTKCVETVVLVTGATEVDNTVGPKMVVVGIMTVVMNVGTVRICCRMSMRVTGVMV
jgi:hypothetical protein